MIYNETIKHNEIMSSVSFLTWSTQSRKMPKDLYRCQKKSKTPKIPSNGHTR